MIHEIINYRADGGMEDETRDGGGKSFFRRKEKERKRYFCCIFDTKVSNLHVRKIKLLTKIIIFIYTNINSRNVSSKVRLGYTFNA